VSTVSKQAFVVNGSPALPVKTVAELIAYAKQKPEGPVDRQPSAPAPTSHIIAEWIARTLGIKAVFVPYKGTSQSTLDLISGRIDVQIDGISTAVTMHNAGKTRIVASMGDGAIDHSGRGADVRGGGLPAIGGIREFRGDGAGGDARRGDPQVARRRSWRRWPCRGWSRS
jgi:hypothetical protein